MKKIISLICMVLVAVAGFASVMHAQENEDVNTNVEVPIGSPEQNEYFYVLDENGNVEYIEYDSYEYDETLDRQERSLFRNAKYQVAKIKGYVTYTEAATGLKGYTHGNSATDAAYIQTNSNGTIRVKQAGVVMDIPKADISLVDFMGDNVSTYTTSNGRLYHNFIYNQNQKGTNWVGYQQPYMEANATYYSYDGHYFYKDYGVMIEDYRANTYKNSINPNTPYYNYYQFLSHRTTTTFTADMFDNRIKEVKGQNTNSKLKDAGKDFITAQNTYGVNAALMWGVSVNESGWGLSEISQQKNNLFGHKAYDSDTNAATKYNTVLDSINVHAKEYISSGYLDPTDYRYRGPHLGDKQSGINVKYASDPYWGEKAAAHLYQLNDKNNRIDYGVYSLGAVNGSVNIYPTAVPKSPIYNTSSGENKPLENNMVVILGEEKGNDGTIFYKIASDTPLKEDRKSIDPNSIYKAGRDYVYIKKNEVKEVSQGSSVLYRLGMREEAGYALGLKAETSINNLIQNIKAINDKAFVGIKDASGNTVSSGRVATGMSLTLQEGGKNKTYTLVIKGDVNGDGAIYATDYVKIKNFIMGKNSLNGAYLYAADVNADGNVYATDYVKIKNYIMGKGSIDQ